jgi:competence ComEA-like helix-hairpin-helix protein
MDDSPKPLQDHSAGFLNGGVATKKYALPASLFRSKFQAVLFCILLLFAGLAGRADCLTGKCNINTATSAELQNLPYIGEGRAEAIIRYRLKNGPFTSLDQMRDAAGIGEKTLDAILPYVTLSGLASSQSSLPSPITAMKHPGRLPVRENEMQLLTDRDYYDALLAGIENAESEIVMAMFLFKTTDSPKNRPAILLHKLIEAAKRGVSIDVILEKSDYDDDLNKVNRKVARELKRHNIAVRFDSPRTTTHAKLIIIDRRYTFLGSHNLSHSALTYNHEVSLLIDNRSLAERLLQYTRKL